MMERIDWRTTPDPEGVVHRAVDRLMAGELVVFPTETVYGVAALASRADAVERLTQLKDRPEQQAFALALGSPDDCLEYVPQMGVMGRRLVERGLPGPLTIVFTEATKSAPLSRLPAAVVDKVLVPTGMGVRVPDHPVLLQTLRLISTPLVLTSANPRGKPAPVTGAEAAACLDPQISLLIDDGPTRYEKPSTVVQVTDRQFKILREGVLSETRVRRLGSEFIVFVCTGNTCRSPMAEAIFKTRLAAELGCEVADLPAHGLVVQSAGMSAFSGAPASAEARTVVREYNATLDDHVSQGASSGLFRLADRIIVMTHNHKAMIVDQMPEVEAKTSLLCGDTDVSDPFGGSEDRYRMTARQIADSLDGWVAQLRGNKVLPPR